MNMRSPIVAMLWEIWRVTRVEAAWKLAFCVVTTLASLGLSAVLAPSAVFAPAENARLYKVLLFLPHIIGWLSLAGLNGGKPGFPLYLLYTRPMRTAVMVGVPMTYLTAMTFAIYLVSAFLLREASGYAFSVLPAAAWIAAIALVLYTIGFSTRSVVVMMLGWLLTLFVGGSFVGVRLDSFPNDVNYPLTDYAVIALIGLVCFGVTVASVARQRRGDAPTGITWAPRVGLWGWVLDLFPFRCPTSSATRAQIWLDLKFSGLPVLAIGAVLAMVILLVAAVGNPIDAALQDKLLMRSGCANNDCFLFRAMPVFFTGISILLVLFLAGNAFGIRRRQGRTYVSAFEATQPFGAAQMAALKVLVKSGCALAAIIAIGVSFWTSIPLLGDPTFVQIWNVPLSSRLPAIHGAIAALTVYEQLSLVVLAAVGVVIWVAAFAVFGAIRTRYTRRVNIAASSLLLFVLTLALVLQGRAEGIVSPFVFDAVFAAARWIFMAALAAMVLTTVYVFWSAFAERLLTIRYMSGAIAISVAFGAAWLIVLHMAGVQLVEMSAMTVVSILSPALLPPVLSVLAPWSLNRVRHM
jgi:hypothetical protein